MAEFGAAVGAWAAKAKRRLDATVSEVVDLVGERIIETSPVDTGLFRSNWLLGVDEIQRLTVKRTDLEAVNSPHGWPERPTAHRYIFSNALPYALRLEYGFTGPDTLGRVYNQAPAGFLARLPGEFPQIVERAARAASVLQ